MTDNEIVIRKDQFRELCQGAGCWVTALEENNAGDFVSRLLDAVIKILRGDPLVPQRSVQAWDLCFADLRRNAEGELEEFIAGKIDPGALIDEIVNAVDEVSENGGAQ